MALSASSPPNRADVLAVGEYLAVFLPGDHALVAFVIALDIKRVRGNSVGPRGRRSAVAIAHARPPIKLNEIFTVTLSRRVNNNNITKQYCYNNDGYYRGDHCYNQSNGDLYWLKNTDQIIS